MLCFLEGVGVAGWLIGLYLMLCFLEGVGVAGWLIGLYT